MNGRLYCISLCAFFSVFIYATTAQSIDFKGITVTNISGEYPPVQVTANGRVITGGIRTNDPSDFEAFRLDLDTWNTAILTYSTPGSNQTRPAWSRSFGGSADGSTVLIQSYLNNMCFLNDCNTRELFGYSWKNGVLTKLPWLSGDDQAWPLDATADGSKAVGFSFEYAHTLFAPNLYRNAVSWNTSTGSITDLGKYADDDDSWAVAVSEDGSVIVGQSGLVRQAHGETWWRPVFWRPAYGWYPLERYHLGSYTPYYKEFGNIAHGMSNDGKIAVGNLYDGTSHVFPVFWDLDPTSPNFQDATTLPMLPGDEYTSGRAYASSKNIPSRGYVIGGYVGDDPYCIKLSCRDYKNATAVLWETNSMTFPKTVESILLGLALENEIAGWQFETVDSISDDAKVITGTGIHPNGQRWHWYADLRNPPFNETRAKAQYIGQSIGNLFTHKAITKGTTIEASPSFTQVAGETSRLRPTVWYSYKAEQDGYLNLDLDGTLPYALIAVYKENETVPFAYKSGYACNNPDSGGPCLYQGEVKIDADTMYYISIGGYEVPQGEHSFDLYHQFSPLSDDCDNGFFVSQTLPAFHPSSTIDAQPVTAPTCNGVPVSSPGVWFKVVGTGGYMYATLDGAADYDTRMSVYCSGCGTSPTCIAANDDINGQHNKASSVGWCTNPGMVYHILVHGYDTDTGNFTLKVDDSSAITCLPGTTISCPVANTYCNEPVPIEGTGTITGDNTNAGTHTSQTSCGAVNNDVWFSYTAQCDGQVVVDTCQPTGDLANTTLAIYDSCGGTELSCNDSSSQGDCNGFRSAIFYDADPGEELIIMTADSGSAPDMGTFPLRVQELPADVDIQEMTLQNYSQGEPLSLQLPISGGCPRPETGYHSHLGSDPLPPGLKMNRTGLITGTPTASGKYSFEVLVSDGNPLIPSRNDSAQYEMTILPPNDTCATSHSVKEGLTLFGNTTATSQSIPPAECNGSTYSSDLWFTYTSACTGIAKASTCSSNFDTTLALYPGDTCPTSGSSQQCSTDAPSCGSGSLGSELEFSVVKNQDYFLRIGSSDATGGAQGNGELLITCFSDCNNNMINDLTDIGNGTSQDTNSNSIPDECENLKKDFSMLLYLPAILSGTNK